jgi:OOP family OmpA-OmpF porin
MRSITHTALVALAIGIALCTPVLAQNQVQIFEEAPSLEQLRAILIPQSAPGTSRKIEIPRPQSLAVPGPIQSTAAPAALPLPEPAASGKADAAAPAPQPQPSALKPAALPKPAAAAAAVSVVGFRINFAANSEVVPASSRGHLDRIAELLRQEPALTLTIEGHTDAHGSAEYNLELSRRRAVAVMRYLVGHGIDGDRLVAVGKGKTAPLTDNPFDGQNRRVQFVNTQAASRS